MANVELLLEAWDMAHWELGEALDGLADEDLWRRPAPSLLSVGELMGHMGYWEASRFTGPRAENDPRGPLLDERFRYYDTSLEQPVVLDLGVAEMQAELKRIHESAVAAVRALNPDSADAPPSEIMGMWDGSTWGDLLKYMVFHVGYHTGQAYSARHLMGHSTKDN